MLRSEEVSLCLFEYRNISRVSLALTGRLLEPLQTSQSAFYTFPDNGNVVPWSRPYARATNVADKVIFVLDALLLQISILPVV